MTTTPAPGLTAVLDTTRTLLEPALREAVATHLGPQMNRIARYHFGWSDAEGRPTGAWGGKMIRPNLALLSARAAGAEAEDGLPAAVAIELVHNFSLLHDDIMDGDETRRGRATAWTVFGVPGAVLAGDALVAAATCVLLAAPAAGARSATLAMTAATRRMIDGQAADSEFERREDVTLAECVRMAGDKTGALLGSACGLGADLQGAERRLVERLEAFGEHIGLAFQLVDDLLGIWGESAQTGKQVGADLRVRKKSLPVVAALNAPGTDELRALYLRPEPLTEPDIRRVTTLVERAGGRDWAQNEADRQIAAAEECLTAVDLPDDVRRAFTEVAGFVVGRRL
ncbi:polyprenyl synthetase family protein [Streptomyces olivaceus]|uniref:polyprenyl synthetase family protein n=1 Tax=Streptomyces TaxID=1883 RepID=UPI0018A8318A|nr:MULTISPECIES: polyprenyl synthetase family protein [Streptomyces]MBF8171665.1 polyprenyl synthetase family protein [Streptomyces olivaceus]UOG79583.1 polyprenyl synthetase family protein [Streptomyces sp. CB09030]WFB85301.1 polyprenyl synthetase family protein [Streptomyces olivaceus]WGK49076.1 polyprenyl synthetase family protein [Streptomyces sp. B146]